MDRCSKANGNKRYISLGGVIMEILKNLEDRFYNIIINIDPRRERIEYTLQGEVANNLDFLNSYKMERRVSGNVTFWKYEKDGLSVCLTEDMK